MLKGKHTRRESPGSKGAGLGTCCMRMPTPSPELQSSGPQRESRSVVNRWQSGEELWKQKWRTFKGWPVTDMGGGALLLPYICQLAWQVVMKKNEMILGTWCCSSSSIIMTLLSDSDIFTASTICLVGCTVATSITVSLVLQAKPQCWSSTWCDISCTWVLLRDLQLSRSLCCEHSTHFLLSVAYCHSLGSGIHFTLTKGGNY